MKVGIQSDIRIGTQMEVETRGLGLDPAISLDLDLSTKTAVRCQNRNTDNGDEDDPESRTEDGRGGGRNWDQGYGCSSSSSDPPTPPWPRRRTGSCGATSGFKDITDRDKSTQAITHPPLIQVQDCSVDRDEDNRVAHCGISNPSTGHFGFNNNRSSITNAAALRNVNSNTNPNRILANAVFDGEDDGGGTNGGGVERRLNGSSSNQNQRKPGRPGVRKVVFGNNQTIEVPRWSGTE